MKILRRKCMQLAALSVVLASVAAFIEPAWPQAGRPVRVIIPFPPGGSADVLARILGQQIGEANNQTVIVENHPGAGASIAYDLTARAAPDGNTIVVAANSVVINPILRKTNYDPVTSFEPICNLAISPMVFVVESTSPYKTIGDLIAAAHAKPGTLTLAAPRPGHHTAYCRRTVQTRNEGRHDFRALYGRRTRGQRTAGPTGHGRIGQLL